MRILPSKILSGLILSILLASCSSGGGNNSDCTTITLDLVGTWLSDCIVDGVSMSHTTQLEFTATTIAIDQQNYSDAVCGTSSGSVVSNITGTYTIGCAVMDSHGLTAAQLDLVADANGFTYYEIAYIDGMGQLLVGGDANTTAYPTSLDLMTTYTRI